MPYRSTRVDTPKLTAEAGIVDDMVRQFADRYAFLRELVQNGIDAGATRIDVRLERGPDGAVRTSVEDDGSGMTRDIIEGPLLTLFESSKEGDSSKIGKYGIGFVSVFAIEPDRVEVRTRRAEGEAWLVKLLGDHSFELSADARRPGRGTEVSLVQTMTAEAFAEHASLARVALARWCRHARLPLTLSIVDGYDSGQTISVNVPLALPGAATVTVTEGDETFVVSAGEAEATADERERSPSFGGFYNRGLTLMERTSPERGLEGLRFKIDSPRLAHTLSRDSVRRDDETRRVLARAKAIAMGPLAEELRARLEEAATDAATGRHDKYLALLDAATRPPFRADASVITVPLVDPLHGESTLPLGMIRRDLELLRREPVLVAEASTAMTRAITLGGRAVVKHLALAPYLRRLLGEDAVIAVEDAYAFACVTETRAEDAALCDELTRLLVAAGKNVGRACLAAFEGAFADQACRVADTTNDFVIVATEGAAEREWGTSATLFLGAEHATVRLARRRARSDVALAAQLLCRTILIGEGPLDARVVDRLLEAASRPHE